MSSSTPATLHVARAIHTLDERHGTATGVLVRDGRVVTTGDAAQLRPDAGAVIDHGEAVLTPGLVDGHTHPVHGLEGTFGVELTGIRTVAEVRAALAEAAARLAPGSGCVPED